MDTYTLQFERGRTEPVWMRMIRTSGHRTVSEILAAFHESAGLPSVESWKLTTAIGGDAFPSEDLSVKNPDSIDTTPTVGFSHDTIPLDGSETPFRYVAGELNLQEGNELYHSITTESGSYWRFRLVVEGVQRNTKTTGQPRVLERRGNPIGRENPFRVEHRFVETGESLGWFE